MTAVLVVLLRMRSGSTVKAPVGMLAAGPYPSGTFCLLISYDSGADALRRYLPLGIRGFVIYFNKFISFNLNQQNPLKTGLSKIRILKKSAGSTSNKNAPHCRF